MAPALVKQASVQFTHRSLPTRNNMASTRSSSLPYTPRHPLCGLLFLLCITALHRADAKLITGLAPCPKGVPPARECLVSVLVDLRALRARARARSNSTLPGVEASLAPKDASQEPSQDLPLAPSPPSPSPPPPPPPPPQQSINNDLRAEQEQQQRRQQQLEQAVRFQEDELQQLRDQVQELRLQLSRALQLYQLTAGAPPQYQPQPPPGPPGVKSLQLRVPVGGPSGYYQPLSVPRHTPDLRAGFTGYGPAHEGASRRFYRTLPAPVRARRPPTMPAAESTPVFGQRLHLAGLRELASGDVVMAT